ncbi:MAG: lipoyl(octanoyl) transferase LipB [Pseudomonadota bacterium]|nr:lipoyl(octanoyl) transferase LipB [Pseudomonadota bacterium]
MILKDFGLMDYEKTNTMMQSFNDNRGEDTEDEIWILEHDPVYTYGVSTNVLNIPSHLPYPIIKTDRGGEITYHGPGQLVVYILMDFHRALIKPKEFIGKFQTSIYKALSTYCQGLVLNQEETGIFYKHQKIASFGLKMTKRGSYHGVAINRKMNLDAWKEIVICGNPDHQATDLFSLGANVDRDKLANEIMRNIRLEFDDDI